MDEHARRVCAPLKSGWTDFETGRATLLDLARLAEQASSALDNASAPLLRMLTMAANDLEIAYHTRALNDHLPIGQRILGPVLSRIDT